MTIQYFAEDQNVVFVPALFALLAAAVLICVPIVFVQGLTRSGRRVPVFAVAWTLGAVAIGIAVWQAGIGFGTLGAERVQVRAELRSRYGVELTAGQVDELIDGGRPAVALPGQAAAAKLTHPEQPKALELVPAAESTDTYELTIGKRPWPA